MNQPQRIRGGAHSWIRGNVLGLVAIFIALSGSALATQVATTHVATTSKIKRGPRGKPGPPGAPGPQGIPGTAGVLSGPASGDLTGNYPNPQIAPEAVGPPETGVVPAARLFNNGSGTSVPSATDTTIPFVGEFFDTANMHDTVTNNQSLTAPIDGIYLVEASLSWDPADAGGTLRAITVDGAATGDTRAALPTTDNTSNAASATVRLFQNDEVHLVARQESGSALLAFAQLSMVWLAPVAPE